MPGLGAFALAGAAEGLGTGIIEQANQRREEAKERLRRQQEVEDRDLAYNRERENVERGARVMQDMYGNGGVGGTATGGGDIRANLNPEGPAMMIAGRLREHGYNDMQIAGILGNLQQESGFNAAAVGDNGASVNMGQWQGDRRTNLQRKAQEWGYDLSDPLLTADFINWEIRGDKARGEVGPEAGSWAEIQASNPQDADDWAVALSKHYWRPGTPHNENRAAYANEAWTVLADPDTPREVREAVARGLGVTMPGDTEADELWVETSPGIETRMRKDASGNYQPVNGPDGKALTQRTGTGTSGTVLSAGMETKLRDDFKTPFMEEVDMQIIDGMTNEMLRLMQEENLTEEQALARARQAMVFEETYEDAGGWSPFDNVEKNREYTGWHPEKDGRFTGRFEYGDAPPPPAGGDGTDPEPEEDGEDPDLGDERENPEHQTGAPTPGLATGTAPRPPRRPRPNRIEEPEEEDEEAPEEETEEEPPEEEELPEDPPAEPAPGSPPVRPRGLGVTPPAPDVVTPEEIAPQIEPEIPTDDRVAPQLGQPGRNTPQSSPTDPPNDGAELPEGYTRDQVLAEARDALAQGKDRAAIVAMLREWGIDESEL